MAAALSLSTVAWGSNGAEVDPQPPLIHFQGSSQELTMTAVADRLLVHGKIGEAGPYAFVIDTGAGVSVVDTKIADDLSLQSLGILAVGAPGGNQVDSDRVLVPRLTVDGLIIEQLSPVVLDIEAMSGGLIQGVLGVDVFADLTLTLDPFRKVATVSTRHLLAGSPGVIGYDDSQGRMALTIDIDGVAVPMQIDTGSPSAFTIPPRFRRQLKTNPATEHKRTAMLVGGAREVTTAQLIGTVSFAELRFVNPSVAFMDPAPDLGNIGGAILNQLVISIDSRNKLLAFHKPMPKPVQTGLPAPPTTTDNGPRRLGVQFGGGPGLSLADVGSVAPNSLGQRAGFKQGDTIISLNGVPMANYDVASLGSTIRSEAKLRFLILRQGIEQLIEID